MKATFPSIYERMVAAGVQIDHHETDLYVPANPVTRELVREWKFRAIAKTFVSQIDGKLWFDLPFAYLPAWERKTPFYDTSPSDSITELGNQRILTELKG